MVLKTTYTQINNLFEKMILQVVESELPTKRKRKYSNKYFLENFKLMLNDQNNWRSLKKLQNYPKHSEFHYKYLNQIFNLWSEKKVFEKAYELLLKEKYFKLRNLLNARSINVFIDATFVTNKYGVQYIARNPEYKKKKFTKLSIICDESKTVLSVIPIKPTEKGKKKTYSHDVKNVQQTIDNIKINIPKYKTMSLIGDKGYITQEKFTLNGQHKKIITPKRTNQKTKNTKSENKKLEKRYVIENVNAFIKKYERIMVRKDKNINTYMSFVYLGLIIFFIKHNKLE